jgi:hypothetical protein
MSDQHDSAASHDFAEPTEPGGDFASSAPASPPRATQESKARFDLATLASWLPRLGAVLWMERATNPSTAARAVAHPRGVLLLDHPALSPLVRCVAATSHTQVTSHGPREWLCLRANDGASLAKLFLLPDTDYLAWDEMTAALNLAPAIEAPVRWHAHAAFLRTAFARLGAVWRARLMTFEQRRLPWLQTLDARPPLRISLLGIELARAIALSENAELSSPLHAA